MKKKKFSNNDNFNDFDLPTTSAHDNEAFEDFDNFTYGGQSNGNG